MAWVESHTVLNRHRKVIDLASALGIKPVQALGHLHALWHTALEQQEDGNLSNWSDAFLASAADFEGDPKAFRKALEAVHWLDDGLIHDWLDYAGKWLISRYSTAKRSLLVSIWKVHGLRYGSRDNKSVYRRDVKRTGSEQKANLPNLTNHTVPNPPNQLRTPASNFKSLWKDYPRKLGRDAAERHFKAQVKTPSDWLDIQLALANFNNHLAKKGTDEDYIPHGSTWFNGRWRDWITYSGATVPKAPAVKVFRKPEIHPPDPTAAEIKEMHDAKVRALGTCRVKGCAFCGTEKE